MRKDIPPFKLLLQPEVDEARNLAKFRWAPREVGSRHQLGGQPSLLQKLHWPECPNGHGEMTFYGQLDSVGDELCIADCGMIYVFLCFDCFEARAIVQSS
jgi:hypothetical protein